MPQLIEASGIPVRCSHSKIEDVINLVEHPRNPNKHPDSQVALLAKVIRHQGWRSPIVISKRSGFIVSGHGRLQAAKLLNVQTVPVDFQEFETEADELAHLLADNRIAELAELDSLTVDGLLDDLKKLDCEIDLSGFTSDEIIDSVEQVNGLTPEEKLPGFENSTVRQLVLIYDAEQFAEVVGMLNELGARLGLETHQDVVDLCVRNEYAKAGSQANQH